MEIPKYSQYQKALEELRSKKKITDGQIKMLRKHFYSHNRTISFSDLAEAGYGKGTKYYVANSHYGGLAHKLCKTDILIEWQEEINKIRSANKESKESWWVDIIGTWFVNQDQTKGNKKDRQDFQLIMHHELAHAIEHIEWI